MGLQFILWSSASRRDYIHHSTPTLEPYNTLHLVHQFILRLKLPLGRQCVWPASSTYFTFCSCLMFGAFPQFFYCFFVAGVFSFRLRYLSLLTVPSLLSLCFVLTLRVYLGPSFTYHHTFFKVGWCAITSSLNSRASGRLSFTVVSALSTCCHPLDLFFVCLSSTFVGILFLLCSSTSCLSSIYLPSLLILSSTLSSIVINLFVGVICQHSSFLFCVLSSCVVPTNCFLYYLPCLPIFFRPPLGLSLLVECLPFSFLLSLGLLLSTFGVGRRFVDVIVLFSPSTVSLLLPPDFLSVSLCSLCPIAFVGSSVGFLLFSLHPATTSCSTLYRFLLLRPFCRLFPPSSVGCFSSNMSFANNFPSLLSTKLCCSSSFFWVSCLSFIDATLSSSIVDRRSFSVATLWLVPSKWLKVPATLPSWPCPYPLGTVSLPHKQGFLLGPHLHPSAIPLDCRPSTIFLLWLHRPPMLVSSCHPLDNSSHSPYCHPCTHSPTWSYLSSSLGHFWPIVFFSDILLLVLHLSVCPSLRLSLLDASSLRSPLIDHHSLPLASSVDYHPLQVCQSDTTPLYHHTSPQAWSPPMHLLSEIPPRNCHNFSCLNSLWRHPPTPWHSLPLACSSNLHRLLAISFNDTHIVQFLPRAFLAEVLTRALQDTRTSYKIVCETYSSVVQFFFLFARLPTDPSLVHLSNFSGPLQRRGKGLATMRASRVAMGASRAAVRGSRATTWVSKATWECARKRHSYNRGSTQQRKQRLQGDAQLEK
eukprot:Gb_09820 [translate_table: standard]